MVAVWLLRLELQKNSDVTPREPIQKLFRKICMCD